MGNEKFGTLKVEEAKTIIENIAEYLETQPMSRMVFGKIAWDWGGKPKKDYTKLTPTFAKALVEVLDEHFREEFNLTKEDFDVFVKQVHPAFEIFKRENI